MMSWLSGCSVNTNHTFLKKTMTNKDHRIHKNTAYISINMLYFYVLYNRGHCFIIRTLDSHFAWAMTPVGFFLLLLCVFFDCGFLFLCLVLVFFSSLVAFFLTVFISHTIPPSSTQLQK